MFSPASSGTRKDAIHNKVVLKYGDVTISSHKTRSLDLNRKDALRKLNTFLDNKLNGDKSVQSRNMQLERRRKAKRRQRAKAKAAAALSST